MEIKKRDYKAMTFRAWLELATPNTWGASIMPVLLGVSLAYAFNSVFNWLNFLVLLVCSVLMHCAVNACNHLFDYLNGTDSKENCLDPHDAPMVYHDLNPRTVALLALFYLALSFVLGLYLVSQVGYVLLVVGVIGGLVVVFYAGGPLPITHTPFGELAAGGTTGGLITFAAYFTMTGVVNWWIFLYALPGILVIGCVLLLNNTCDIEKDIEAGRHTLAILVGRPVATALLRGGYIAAGLVVVAICLFKFTAGAWVLIPGFLLCRPKFRAVLTMDFTATTRISGMKAVLPLTPLLLATYVVSIWADVLISSIL